MKHNLHSATFFVLAFLVLNSSTYGQTINELKKQKMAEKNKKLKKAKERAAQEVVVFGYHGGTMAPIGFNIYVMHPNAPGFYGSIRFGQKKHDVFEPYKNLNLNFGFTQNLAYPFAIYVAAGISDWETRTPKKPSSYISNYPTATYNSYWHFGFDTSFGLIMHLNGVELQAGLSLFNFSKPEFCFGIGLNALRSTK